MTTSNHISRPSTEPTPCRRRPRSSSKRGTWTDSQLHDALVAVDGGMSMKKASDLYHIPYSSFREWCYGLRTSRKMGPPAVLSPSEEKQLVDYCIRMCEMGQGLTPSALKLKVYDITKSRPTPFHNGIPGEGWMRWWRHRHLELSLRVSQALEVYALKTLRASTRTCRVCSPCISTVRTKFGTATSQVRKLGETEEELSSVEKAPAMYIQLCPTNENG